VGDAAAQTRDVIRKIDGLLGKAACHAPTCAILLVYVTDAEAGRVAAAECPRVRREGCRNAVLVSLAMARARIESHDRRRAR
jgi:hypothetical protein